MLRSSRSLRSTIMASLHTSAIPNAVAPKMVPIPANGVNYRNKIVLAPMVRSSELPMRLVALRYGADLVWGPETIDKSLIGTTRRHNHATGTIDWTRWSSRPDQIPTEKHRESVIFSLHPEKEKGKLIFQIGTANPELAVAAAKLVAADVAGIDVNSGCPKPFSTLGGMGAALLKEPDRLCSILEALVKEVGEPFKIGISVKIRLLAEPEDTATLVNRLVKTGITGLTIHCRTAPMRKRERAIRDQLAMVGNICREAGVACLMNGDVTTRDEAVKLAAEYGVDGAMIATAAEANPSIFRPLSDGGPAAWREVACHYLRDALAVENRYGNTKFSLAQIMGGKSKEGQASQRAKCYLHTVQALDMEDELGAQARLVDEKLGLDARVEILAREAEAKEKKRKNQSSAQPSRKRVATEENRFLKQGTTLQADAMVLPSQPATAALSV